MIKGTRIDKKQRLTQIHKERNTLDMREEQCKYRYESVLVTALPFDFADQSLEGAMRQIQLLPNSTTAELGEQFDGQNGERENKNDNREWHESGVFGFFLPILLRFLDFNRRGERLVERYCFR